MMFRVRIFLICLQEADRWDLRQSAAVRTCIEDNIHFTKIDRETKLLQSDVISAIRSMEGKYKFDVIFMDPPYKHEYEKEVLECLKDSSILKEDTLIIVEASLDTSFDYLSELGFTLKKLKTYKTNVHAFITKAE